MTARERERQTDREDQNERINSRQREAGSDKAIETNIFDIYFLKREEKEMKRKRRWAKCTMLHAGL